jgi:hypothetical protein
MAESKLFSNGSIKTDSKIFTIIKHSNDNFVQRTSDILESPELGALVKLYMDGTAAIFWTRKKSTLLSKLSTKDIISAGITSVYYKNILQIYNRYKYNLHSRGTVCILCNVYVFGIRNNIVKDIKHGRHTYTKDCPCCQKQVCLDMFHLHLQNCKSNCKTCGAYLNKNYTAAMHARDYKCTKYAVMEVERHNLENKYSYEESVSVCNDNTKDCKIYKPLVVENSVKQLPSCKGACLICSEQETNLYKLSSSCKCTTPHMCITCIHNQLFLNTNKCPFCMVCCNFE